MYVRWLRRFVSCYVDPGRTRDFRGGTTSFLLRIRDLRLLVSVRDLAATAPRAPRDFGVLPRDLLVVLVGDA